MQVFKNFLGQASHRSRNIAKNIAYIFFIKGISILLSFLVIPLTLEYVGKPLYGIWLTMFSIVSWLSLFDVGLGNGLRNNLSAALARKEIKDAAQYVSTTYFAMTIISILLLSITIIFAKYLDWKSILKLPDDYPFDVSRTLIVLSAFFCVRFIIQLISSIFYAVQKAFMVDLVGMAGNLLSLCAIYFGRDYYLGDRLLFLVYALCLPPIIAMFITSICIFLSKSYKFLRPRIENIKKEKIENLVNLGMKFFLLQICGLLTYSMTNFLILQFLSADDVTNYNLSYKYFSALLILNNMICAPLWSAFTEAYELGDFRWIKNCRKKMGKVFLAICFIGGVMVIISPMFYRIWLNNMISIPFLLSVVMMLFILTSCFNGIVISFINGVGKIKLQSYMAIVSTLIYIPICKFLAVNLSLGVIGFVLYMFFSNAVMAGISAIQMNRIINGRACGIWGK